MNSPDNSEDWLEDSLFNVGHPVISVYINKKFLIYLTGVFNEPNCLNSDEFDFSGTHWALAIGKSHDPVSGD